MKQKLQTIGEQTISKSRMMALLLGVVLFAIAVGPQKLFAEKLIVGVSSVNVAFLPLYVTEDKGFFKNEGLDVCSVAVARLSEDPCGAKAATWREMRSVTSTEA